MIHFQVIRASIAGQGKTDKSSLTRVIVTRAEVDMQKIKGEYRKISNVNLDDVVTRDVSGVYKDFLMALIGTRI